MNQEKPKYHLSWDIHPGGIDASEIEAAGIGGCDCGVFISIIGKPVVEGEVSYSIQSFDGHNDCDLSPLAQFQAWIVWGTMLLEILPEDAWQKRIVKIAVEAVRDIVKVVNTITENNEVIFETDDNN